MSDEWSEEANGTRRADAVHSPCLPSLFGRETDGRDTAYGVNRPRYAPSLRLTLVTLSLVPLATLGSSFHS